MNDHNGFEEEYAVSDMIHLESFKILMYIHYHFLIDFYMILPSEIEPLTMNFHQIPLENNIFWLSACFNIKSLLDTILVPTWLDFGIFGSQSPSKSCLGGVLEVILAVLATLEGLWERLRLVLGRLEGILDRLGGILGRLGGVLEAS